MLLAKYSFRSDLTLAVCILALSPICIAAETVTVNLGMDGGEVRYRASGFLHGFSIDGQFPPDSIIIPLKVQLHRTSARTTWSQAERMKALGIQQQVVMSDDWGYAGDFPGDDENWGKWEEFVVNMVKEAQRRGLKPQWDIWNEPDDKTVFWKRSPEQFNETWRRACRKIRETDPTAVVVGPSWSWVHPGDARFSEFIRYCQENRVMPDYVCWHFPRNIVKEIEDCRRLLADQHIQVKGIMINEYCWPQEAYAGKTAWLIAQIERAKVDAACHAVWNGNPLNDIISVTPSATPKGQWWVYQRYAAITGRLVATMPGPNIDLVAGTDERTKTVRVLLGNSGGAKGDLGDVTVRLMDIDKVPYIREGDGVHVVVERIPEENGGPVTGLQVVLDRHIPVRDNAIDVRIPWNSDRDAFAVQLGPGER